MQTTTSNAPRRLSWRAALICSLMCLGTATPTWAAGTLDKVRDTGKLTLGYASDARPFAYADASGKPSGYAIELCAQVADAVKSELKLATLAVEFVALSRDEAFRAVEQGKADLLCGVVPTLERRALVDFSIPIMLSGTTAAVRTDTAARIAQALSGRQPSGPAWRGSSDQAPQRAVLAVVGGTVIEKALASRLKERRIVAEVVQVKDSAAGLQLLASRGADAFINDRAMLLDAVAGGGASDIVVLDVLFRRDIVALATRRNDDDFRLVVDRALSRLYRTPELARIYTKNFGAPRSDAVDFFQLVALPD
ncbi:MAG TPA: amino acid ABC transporter substrate-binding protein [Burkholderiaceae bacterium]|nr:amino acid ABC transporter substrate-binding protein [Burkholderiaceae bacterium]